MQWFSNVLEENINTFLQFPRQEFIKRGLASEDKSKKKKNW